MSDRGQNALPEDLLPMAERLQQERPSLDGITLDRIKTRARARGTAPHRTGALLKSRLAITMILALGILMSLGGAGLDVSGLGESSDDAVDVQYFNDPDDSSESSSSSETLGDPSDPGDPGDVDAAGQESSGTGGGDLPFTGFAAIPVLIGGVALLGSGFVLRRRSDRDEH